MNKRQRKKAIKKFGVILAKELKKALMCPHLFKRKLKY